MMKGTERVLAVSQATRIVMAASAALLLATVAALATSPAAFGADTREPIPTGPSAKRQRVPDRFFVTESVEVILLDVRVAGENGEPLRGLTVDDFTLRLDGRLWTISSADEICADTEPAIVSAGTGNGATVDGAPVSVAAGSGTGRYILYLDFSSLGQDGRMRSRRAAVRWLREELRSGDLVEVVAYGTKPGVQVLLPWSADAARAEAVVRGAFRDSRFLDIHPMAARNRYEQCDDCTDRVCGKTVCLAPEWCRDSCGECVANARQDLGHSRTALEALDQYLASLEETPGPKSMLLFSQNTVLSPGRQYCVIDADRRVGTLLSHAEAAGAAATAARVSFYPIHTGNNQFDSDLATIPGSNRRSVAFASLLAEYTGGDFSRGPSDVGRVLGEAGRESGCLYRLAFKPPPDDGARVHRAVVSAAGRRVPWTYRVRFLSEADRLMHRARNLMAGISRGETLDVTAALRPVAARDRHWDVEVQIALNPSSLEGLTIGGRERSRLDVGGLLEDAGRGETWEMVGGSEVRRLPGSTTGSTLLYSRLMERLKPGEYRLRVFVHDRFTGNAGRADLSMTLPRPGRDGFLGPLPSLPGRKVYSLELPVVGEEEGPSGEIVKAHAATAPLGRAPVTRGQPVQMTSWICAKKGAEPGLLVRYLERDGVPIYQMPQGWSEEAGDCTRVTDVFHTIELPPGLYTYRTAWRREGDPEPRHASRPVAFTVREKAVAPDAVTRASQ